MPISHYRQLNEIVEVIMLTQPESLLDIGVGFGQYGVLARQHLDARYGRLYPQDWQRRIDGIEVFPNYLTPLHGYIYNHMYTGDALQVIPGLEITYDLALLIDVLEHFEFEQGLALLEMLGGRAHNLLISTPRQFFHQRAAYGNAYEEHRSYWQKKDLQRFSQVCFIPNETSLICLIGREAGRIHQVFYAPKRVLRRSFPLLAGAYRRLKAALRPARGAAQPKDTPEP